MCFICGLRRFEGIESAHIHMSAVGPGRGWGVRILVIPAGALVHRRPCDVEAGRYAFA
jgi:hypothetical protein